MNQILSKWSKTNSVRSVSLQDQLLVHWDVFYIVQQIQLLLRILYERLSSSERSNESAPQVSSLNPVIFEFNEKLEFLSKQTKNKNFSEVFITLSIHII